MRPLSPGSGTRKERRDTSPIGNRAVYSVLDRLPGFDRAAVLHRGECCLVGRKDFLKRPADHERAGIARVALPGRIGVLADDAAIRLHGHEDQIDRCILEDGAVPCARTTQFVHHVAQCVGALGDFAFQILGKAAECALGFDPFADVAPIDRDAVP